MSSQALTRRYADTLFDVVFDTVSCRVLGFIARAYAGPPGEYAKLGQVQAIVGGRDDDAMYKKRQQQQQNVSE